jgi:hypothetical protein
MPKYKDICPECGGEFINYAGIGGRVFCSLLCQYHDCDTCGGHLCEHKHCSEVCAKCRDVAKVVQSK